MAKKEPFISPYLYIEEVDENGFLRLLELKEGFSEEDRLKEKEFRCKNQSPTTIENSRTANSHNGIYEKLFNAKEEDIPKIIIQAVSFSQAWNFKPKTFAHILKLKRECVSGEIQKKFVDLAILALETNGTIPKKLKAAYTLATTKETE